MVICRIATRTATYTFTNGVVNIQANNKAKTIEVYNIIEVIKTYNKITKEFDHKREVYHFTFTQEDVIEIYLYNRVMDLKKLFKEKDL